MGKQLSHDYKVIIVADNGDYEFTKHSGWTMNRYMAFLQKKYEDAREITIKCI